jgi:hypothetical protein
MDEEYIGRIEHLMDVFPLEIDHNIEVKGGMPTMATSSFLTNKEQGDWAEEIAYRALNEYSDDYFIIKYGRHESIAAGEEGFDDFYRSYQYELNTLGKKPDLLVFRTLDFPDKKPNLDHTDEVSKAIAALEVRSSSFLANKYSQWSEKMRHEAISLCLKLRDEITSGESGSLLKRKNETIYDLLTNAKENTFREIDFRLPNWSSTPALERLTSKLREMKSNIKILHKRDYLSITPKLEDIALVNRWIHRFGVPHYYLQVFFDKAYVISFENILRLIADSNNEGDRFSIEKDVKNQRKTTIKINVRIGKELLGKIEMPLHRSEMKELNRGRLLFFVRFFGGRGYLDGEVFREEVLHG